MLISDRAIIGSMINIDQIIALRNFTKENINNVLEKEYKFSREITDCKYFYN